MDKVLKKTGNQQGEQQRQEQRKKLRRNGENNTWGSECIARCFENRMKAVIYG